MAIKHVEFTSAPDHGDVVLFQYHRLPDSCESPPLIYSDTWVDSDSHAVFTLNRFLYPLLLENGINTAFIGADAQNGSITFQKLDMLPLKFIWRNKAYGEICSAYRVPEGQKLHGLVESLFKTDVYEDRCPRCTRICEEACVTLGFVKEYHYRMCYEYTKRIGTLLAAEVAKSNGNELVACEVEFGLYKPEVESFGMVKLADEIKLHAFDKDKLWHITRTLAQSLYPCAYLTTKQGNIATSVE